MSCPSISYPHHRAVSGATAVAAAAVAATAVECTMNVSGAVAVAVGAHQPAAPAPTPVHNQLKTELRSASIAMATCYTPYELSPPQRTVQVPVQKEYSVPKDYSRPLHVDCSVEYELPNAAKPPPGVRNEPLLMIHPCYFRKIESQRRSPFVNNLPTRQSQSQSQSLSHHSHHSHSHSLSHSHNHSQTAAAALAVKRRLVRGQQLPQQVPQQAAPYPVQYAAAAATASATADVRQLWEPMPPLVPITAAVAAAQPYCKVSSCGTYAGSSGSDSGHWTDPDRSPDRPEDKHILSGKYRQYLRAHRLHPYVTSAIPLASTFPQMQQVCYNV